MPVLFYTYILSVGDSLTRDPDSGDRHQLEMFNGEDVSLP